MVEPRIAVVTGGAKGIGAAVADRLERDGLVPVVWDIAAPAAAGRSHLICDVSDERAVAQAAAATESEHGPIAVLVNNAGLTGPSAMVADTPLAQWQKVQAINLTGTFNTMRLVAEKMVANEPHETGERGVVVNTASIAAFEGQIGQIAYAASKGGIVAMTLPAARELARHGVRVMTIAPGIMETPMLLGMPEEVQQSLHAMVPFPRRMGKAAEYAALVLHIVSNPYLNGETIRLDGAIRMGAK